MFTIALSNVLVTLFYIFPAYLVRKLGKVSEKHLAMLSATLVYICTPFMEVNSFLSLELTKQTTIDMVLFFIATLCTQALFMIAIYLIFRKQYHKSSYRILTIGSVLGNVGFFGLPIIRALFPGQPEVAVYSMIYIVTMNILVFTVGVFCLTREKKYMSLRSAVFNPTMLGFGLGLICYFTRLGQYLPSTLINAIRIPAEMSTPLCMFVVGIRLASLPFREIFSRPIVYVTSAMKLLVYPVFCFALISLFPVSETFRVSMLVLSGTPCAAVILNMAELHHSEESLSAYCIMVSTLLCFITIPLLTLLI